MCYVVINEETYKEYEYDDIVVARRTLVALVEDGIRVSLIVDKKYRRISY